jgi:cytochrome c553
LIVRALIPLLILLGLALAVAACGPADSRTDQRLTRSGELVALSGGESGAARACFSCHGLDGMGDGVSTPRLAGLDVGYLQKQLDDYASGLRHDALMSPIARPLSGRARQAVATYYDGLPIPDRQGPPPAMLAPAAWTRQGCASCHGAQGQGVGVGNPMISGQPAAYTVEQIRRWRAAERRNDPRGVMANAVAPLRPSEIAAIADWLERRPASPAPDSDAASVSAAGAAAARSAASHEGRRRDR